MKTGERVELLRQKLDVDGYAYIPNYSEMIPGSNAREISFNAHWKDLVRDENYKSYTTRHRRIMRYWYTHPGQLKLNLDSVFQPKVTYEVDYTKGANHLSYVTDAFIQDMLMQEILRLDLNILEGKLSQGRDYSIDIDLFRVSADRGEASPTTSGRHQDGEDFLFMHFIGADNIEPVLSEILPPNPNSTPLLKTALTQFLETLVLDDRLLFHAASAVRQARQERSAHRNLLVVGISALPAKHPV